MDFSPFGRPSRSQVKDLLSSEAPSADAGPFLAVREHKRLGCPLARLRTPEYAWVPWSTREHPRVRLGTREYAWAPLSNLGANRPPFKGGLRTVWVVPSLKLLSQKPLSTRSVPLSALQVLRRRAQLVCRQQRGGAAAADGHGLEAPLHPQHRKYSGPLEYP